MSPGRSILLSPRMALALGGVGDPVEGLRTCREGCLGTDLAKVRNEAEPADPGSEDALLGLRWGDAAGDAGRLAAPAALLLLLLASEEPEYT